MAKVAYGPYFDPDFDSIVERVNPRVCIDNETCQNCTLVKVDSDNRHGILLEMVQLLTDLDLVISKSYISSDGGWLMDVFHVTDQLGSKLTDPTLIRYIEQSMDSSRGVEKRTEVRTCMGKLVGPGHLACEYTIVEITAADRPGLLSEVSAVLFELNCQVVCAQAWTHNYRAAIILYLVDRSTAQPISDLDRLAHIKEQVDSVVEAHYGSNLRRRVTVAGPMSGRVHTERRLHQLMREDRDYEPSCDNAPSSSSWPMPPPPQNLKTCASIDSWKDRGYSVVNIRSKDRPKLLFDTVCTLTDMHYSVFHATVASHGPLALQEYYIRHMDGYTLDTEDERRRVIQCLVAAVERRVSHDLKIDVCTKSRPGLLSDLTRVLREHGMSLTRMECATRGEKTVGAFFVTDASSGGDVDPRRLEAMREEIGENVTVKVNGKSLEWVPRKKNGKTARPPLPPPPPPAGESRNDDLDQGRQRISLGSLLWSHIERFSFGSISS